MSDKNRVCIYCGSKKGKNPAYAEVSRELGEKLAEREIEVVYGGGSIGIMNEVAEAALSHSGKVHGVIPQHLYDMEVAHKGLTALHITDTMHERKALMIELSDAFIALPGGFGTFEELMEAITWRQIRIHDKTVILFNIDGYYDKLIDFIDFSVEQGFISTDNRELLKIATTVDECLEYLPYSEQAKSYL